MSKLNEGIIQLIFCRRATLTCGILLTLGVLFITIINKQLPTKESIASNIYTTFKYEPNIKQANGIVSDASSVVGSQEWMGKKEGQFEARRVHVQEVCAKLNSKNHTEATEQGTHFWFDIRHRIALCTHPKVRLVIGVLFYPKRQVGFLHYSGRIIIMEAKSSNAV